MPKPDTSSSKQLEKTKGHLKVNIWQNQNINKMYNTEAKIQYGWCSFKK